ncbi:HNH/ENDO VII superfamily nuclease [Kribbella antiqua]|uniref:HNH/ENDO VII superfamily nuclease n=1 Tax=Kribbella antiqua TaxID=2512217 RepID=A0A4V2S3Q1_9ACTN|nr:AHH domain-containing protein [Kribbella antiqua]TCO45210.1 HNH/ENDO VII superfamily nuclease [Kribbella antiqua]
MNYDEQRLESMRDEQRREQQRQLERDEIARQEMRRASEATRFNKEFANRCANNDGPATIGGLCASCHAAAVAAERAGEGRMPGLTEPSGDWHAFLERLPIQDHHLASDKSRTERTTMFKEITRKYDLELDGDWNKVPIHHRGRHPDEYHAFVLGTMQFIDQEAKGDRRRFLRMYHELVKDTVVENPEMLRKKAWYE